MIREGQQVTFVGLPGGGHALGDVGRLVSASGQSHGHVIWSTGSRTGSCDLMPFDDLAAASRARQAASVSEVLADSLAVESRLSVRATYDQGGEAALLNALWESGRLAGLSQVGEEALALAASRVREDEGFREVLAELDPDEADSLVSLTAAVLLRDAFTEDNDG